MTGVYVEMLSYGAPFFVLEDKYTETIFKQERITFKNMEEFSFKYRNYLDNKQMFQDEILSLYRYFNEAGDLASNYKRNIEYIIKRT